MSARCGYALASKCIGSISPTCLKRTRPFIHSLVQTRLQHAAVAHQVVHPSLGQEQDYTTSETVNSPGKQLEHTADSYGRLERDARFQRLGEQDVRFFKDLLGGNAVIEGITKDASEDLLGFNMDWTRKYCGRSRLVLKPQSTKQVSQVLHYCNQNKLAVNPQGGNTGLVGGSVPVFDEIVINLSYLDKVRSFDETSGVLVADAGLVLQVAEEHVKERGYVFPLDLGAKGSCQIGGNVSTNAGGLRLLRYGSLHGNVLGLEVVLPDGTIMNDLSVLRKNSKYLPFLMRCSSRSLLHRRLRKRTKLFQNIC